MKLFVTTFDLRPESIAALAARDCDGIELRAEKAGPVDLGAIRAATSKPLLLTYRGVRVTEAQIEAAVAAGLDLVDVEWHADLGEIPHRERIVLSHHDYEGVPDDLESFLDAMLARGCAETKAAVTPHDFASNERLLTALRARPGLTLFGMGERGLYTRILAPFFGSQLTFVAPDDGQLAAPGQLALDRALAIYGDSATRVSVGFAASGERRAASGTPTPSSRAYARDLGGGPVPHNAGISEPPLHPGPSHTLGMTGLRVFAITGNPAGHSLSPSIHNPLFRERDVAAAYTIASVERFDEVTGAFLRGELCGLSVTAPFKEDAWRFSVANGADLRPHADAAEAVNTLVRTGTGIVADNTDVDGFLALIPQGVERAAVIGAGGTARAAIVALQLRGIAFDVFNRTERTILGRVTRPLAEIEGDFLIDTLPGDVRLDLPSIPTLAAAYSRGGLPLLYEQAKRQNVLFLEALT
jgi:3-dehydroquinate dehydratase type I